MTNLGVTNYSQRDGSKASLVLQKTQNEGSQVAVSTLKHAVCEQNFVFPSTEPRAGHSEAGSIRGPQNA